MTDNPRSPCSTSLSSEAGTSVPTILVSPYEITRAGLTALLEGTRFEVVRACNRLGSLDEIAEAPDAVLIIAAASSVRLLEDLRAAKERFARLSLLVLHDGEDPELDAQLLCAGVRGFLDHHIELSALVRAADSVLAGVTVLTPRVWEVVAPKLARAAAGTQQAGLNTLPQPAGRALSARETAILACLADGVSNKLIARRLDITEGTVKVHVKGILRKIGAHNRTQAALWARNHHTPAFGAASQV